MSGPDALFTWGFILMGILWLRMGCPPEERWRILFYSMIASGFFTAALSQIARVIVEGLR